MCTGTTPACGNTCARGPSCGNDQCTSACGTVLVMLAQAQSDRVMSLHVSVCSCSHGQLDSTARENEQYYVSIRIHNTQMEIRCPLSSFSQMRQLECSLLANLGVLKTLLKCTFSSSHSLWTRGHVGGSAWFLSCAFWICLQVARVCLR